MPATPYVTASEFAAHPTYLDLDDLRVDVADPEAQVAELTNILLMASAWADNVCNQTLGAHAVELSTRGRVDAEGTLTVYPSDRPVLAVTSASFGPLWAEPTTLEAPAARVDYNQAILINAGRIAARGAVAVDLRYVAGWVSTLIAEGAQEGDTTLDVADAVGILPGATYRLWEPGREESVTVAPSWTPTAGPASVPLVSPTRYDHDEGGGWSGMPADMRLAVINYGVAQLMRPDTAAEDSFPDTSLSPGTRQQDSRQDGSGLVKEAERILSSYARRM
jgi:hypothetical protein